MKLSEYLKYAGFALGAFTGAVQAGPEVTVTFKNNGSEVAVLDAVGSTTLGYTSSSPEPKASVGAGETDVYKMSGKALPNSTTVVLVYKIGTKSCRFNTSYSTSPSLSNPVPKWDKRETASSGARCEAKITSINQSTHAWTAEFSMR